MEAKDRMHTESALSVMHNAETPKVSKILHHLTLVKQGVVISDILYIIAVRDIHVEQIYK